MRNSRTPYSQVAKRLGIGESTVYTRINKLVKAGVLKGFTIEVDYVKLGLVVEAVVEIKPIPGNIKGVEKTLSRIPLVAEVLEVSGPYPVQARVVARNNEELSKVIDTVSSIEGVSEINVKYVLRRIALKDKSLLLTKLME